MTSTLSRETLLEDQSLIDFVLVGEEIVMKRTNKKGNVFTSRLLTKAEARQLKDAFKELAKGIINQDWKTANNAYDIGPYHGYSFRNPKVLITQFWNGAPPPRIHILFGGCLGGCKYKFSTKNPQNLLHLADALEEVL